METAFEHETIGSILQHFGFTEKVLSHRSYIHYIGDDGHLKLVCGVTLESGKKLVVKLLREEDDVKLGWQVAENRFAFSEFLRQNGIRTPAHYQSNGRNCIEYSYNGHICHAAVEDWCGEEIRYITADLSYRIGEMMARMHIISLASGFQIGAPTLFGAAVHNDVDCFDQFCAISENLRLDRTLVSQIKELREEKMERIRSSWDTLRRAAVQGDISVNNLVDGPDGLIVFDYNNAGDEVPVSDLILEGLLTAYEMDLPDGVPQSERERFFPAFLDGYLSVRSLTEEERAVAWDIYTLYHGLWFTRIVYNENSLQKLVERGEYDSANALLAKMLSDLTATDDGRFNR